MSQNSQESLESTAESVTATEDEIVPITSPREQASFPEWVQQINSADTPMTNGHNEGTESPVVEPIFENGVEIEESVDIETEREDSPVDEDFIQPSQKSRPLQSLSSNDWLVNDSEPSGYSGVMDSKPLTSIIHKNNIQVEVNSPSSAEGLNDIVDNTVNEDVPKPSTLMVDRIKIKDEDDDLSVETNTTNATLAPAVPEQSSPNDSGIHSDKAPSERDAAEETNPASDELLSSVSSSPPLALRKGSSTSDDLMTAVLSLASVQSKDEDSQPTIKIATPVAAEPSTPNTATSSQISTPR